VTLARAVQQLSTPPAPSPAPPPSARPPETAEEDAGWAFQLESGAPAFVAAKDATPPSRGPLLASPAPVEVAESATDSSVSEPAGHDAQATQALPFSAEVTPSVDRLWDTLAQGVFNDPGTLQGVGGLPEVNTAKPSAPVPVRTPTPVAPAVPTPRSLTPKPMPSPAPQSSMSAPAAASARPPRPTVHGASDKKAEKIESTDGLADALTQDSPVPVPARPIGATQVMAAVTLPANVTAQIASREAEEAGEAKARPEPPPSTLASRNEPKTAPVAARGPKAAKAAKAEPRTRPVEVAPVRVARPAVPPSASNWSAWLVPALLAFAVAYGLVTHFREDVVGFFGGHAPSSAPASSR